MYQLLYSVFLFHFFDIGYSLFIVCSVQADNFVCNWNAKQLKNYYKLILTVVVIENLIQLMKLLKLWHYGSLQLYYY